MSRMAKIFCNEAAAIVLSLGIFKIFHLYLEFSVQESYLCASYSMTLFSFLVVFIVARKDPKRNNFIFVGIYAIAGLSLLLLGLHYGLKEELIEIFVIFITAFLLSFLSNQERKISGNKHRALSILLLGFGTIFVSLSSIFPIRISVAGIVIIAIIAFFPSGSGDGKSNPIEKFGIPG
jgi:hypothetical protein